MKTIVIFASGSGSNAENICNYFNLNKKVRVNLILTNNKNAFVLERAKKLNISTVIFNREEFSYSDKILQTLKENKTDIIVLAGFLWLIPKNLIDAFKGKIINIHPALLPNYGGKGMFGNNIHKAVIANKEKESGITIHYVDENYDEGKIILQAKCEITEKDNYETLANKIHKLEFEYFPKAIEQLL